MITIQIYDAAGDTPFDADTTSAGDQAFVYVGRQGFSGSAGELRSNRDFIFGDVDGVTDFTIQIWRVSGDDLVL